MNLNGSNREVIANNTFAPTGLAIDESSKKFVNFVTDLSDFYLVSISGVSESFYDSISGF